MEIATATYADSWGIEELLMQYQEEVVLTNPQIFSRDLDREKLTNAMVDQMDRDNICSTVVRHNDQVVAFSRATEHIHFYTKLIAVQLDMIFLAPSIRPTLLGGRAFVMLLKKFEEWSATRGAKILAISSLAGLKYKGMNRMIEKKGFETIGFNSLKRIEVQNG